MKIILLNSDGATGHVVKKYLEKMNNIVTPIIMSDIFHSIREISEKPYFFIENILSKNKYDVIINLARIINNNAENNPLDSIMINSYLPKFLERITKKKTTKVVHVSTDCVFSGDNGPNYETNLKDGTSYYAISRSLGEINNLKDLTIRTSVIGPDTNPKGNRLFNWFMMNKESIKGFNNVFWNGITSIELSKILVGLLLNDINGIIHIGADKISKYELLKKFNNNFKANKIEIREHPNIKNNKVLLSNRKDYNIKVSSYEVMLKEMKDWIQQNQNIYNLYNIENKLKEKIKINDNFRN